MVDSGLCDFGLRMWAMSQSVVWLGSAPTWERSGPRRPLPPPPAVASPPLAIMWQRAQLLASNTPRPELAWEDSPPAVGGGADVRGSAGATGADRSGLGEELAATGSAFFAERE